MSNNKDFKVKNGLDVGGTIALGAIDTSISDTAVDVFVYDTSKDSDGGAWRKRCQHTSWYNETLNTTTRGATKEFPVVAVIVAESNKVTIYDGDDPAMPMWMVFNATDYSYIHKGVGSNVNSVVVLNGLMVVGKRGSDGSLSVVDFISDQSRIAFDVVVNAKLICQPISGRNNAVTSWRVDGNTLYTGNIIHRSVNDVAITVLPNAPIDSATNLPIPTIAVATDGGVSVIKDDGTVVDIGTWNSSTEEVEVHFTPENYVAVHSQWGGFIDSRIYIYEIPNSDIAHTDVIEAYSGTAFWNGIHSSGSSRSGYNTLFFKNKLAAGVHQSLKHLLIKDRKDDLLANITSDYNTGWMVGDIKLAALSDTDDTDVTGSELVTNGTFDSDLSGWSLTDDGSISRDTTVFTNGGLKVAMGDVYDGALQYITLPSGGTYTISVDINVGTSNSCRLYVGNGTKGSANFVLKSGLGTGTHTATFTTTDTTINVEVRGDTTVGNVYFDNVSLRLAEEDRSVNGNGLQVHGTIDKDPVATGADLVGYSGFSGSNYLKQPYNSDLDFGTGDFSVMGWFKAPDVSTVRCIVSRYSDTSTTSGFNISLHTDGTMYFYTKEGGANTNTPTNGRTPLDNNAWHHFVAVRYSSGLLKIYIDGKEYSSATGTTRNINTTDKGLLIGTHWAGDQSGINNVSLLRISATAPTAEQIAKIYEDEKVLFQEGAKATLYGTSDAVTALAHDDDTGLLHVGTNAGRSVFKGLRRVENTTDAVGACISAANGLIVEE